MQIYIHQFATFTYRILKMQEKTGIELQVWLLHNVAQNLFNWRI